MLPVPFLGKPIVRGIIPGLPGEIPHIFRGLLRADPRELRSALVVTVKARPADPTEPFSFICGMVSDHHAGMQARAQRYKFA